MFIGGTDLELECCKTPVKRTHCKLSDLLIVVRHPAYRSVAAGISSFGEPRINLRGCRSAEFGPLLVAASYRVVNRVAILT